ncbi:MAG: hypothetical protein KDD37_00005, partial [Bdellovibrionales bacterium]|nr:hypothetical protein [Bdellovibrionales bacterium]
KIQSEDVVIGFFDNNTLNIVNRDIDANSANDFEVSVRLAGGPISYPDNYVSTVSSQLVDPINGTGQWVNPTNPLILATDQGNTNINPTAYSADWSTFRVQWTDSFGSSSTTAQRVAEGTSGTAICAGNDNSVYYVGSSICVRPYYQAMSRNAVPFRSTYQVVEDITNNRFDFLPSEPVAGGYKIKWKYLPKTIGTSALTSLIRGTSVYLVNQNDVNDRDVDCKAIVAGQIRSMFVAHKPYVDGTTDASPIDSYPDDMEHTITTANVTTAASIGINSPAAVACPYREEFSGGAKKYWSSGVAGYGFGPAATNNISVSVFPGANPTCKEIRFDGVSDPAAINFGINGTSPGTTPGYYSDDACTASLSSTQNYAASIPANTPTYSVYYMDDLVGGTHTFNFTYVSGGTMPVTFSPTTVSLMMPVAVSFSTSSVPTSSCVGGTVSFPGPVAMGFDCTITSNNPSFVTVSSDPTCTSPSPADSTGTISVNPSDTLIGFGIYRNATGATTITLTCSGVEIDYTNFYDAVN